MEKRLTEEDLRDISDALFVGSEQTRIACMDALFMEIRTCWEELKELKKTVIETDAEFRDWWIL